MYDIATVITDVDGSLTDGGVYYFTNSLQARKFSTMDGEGIAMLKSAGIRVVMLTSSSGQDIVDRANWLEVLLVHSIKDKGQWLTNTAINRDTLAVFGNDLVDLPIMKMCKLPGCPKDSHKKILTYCNKEGVISKYSGGYGAFREFAEFILHYRTRSLKIG